MPIRHEDDGISRVKWQEEQYFRPQDSSITHLNLNRFIYLPVGSKNKFYDWRLDWDKHSIPTTTFTIDQEKFVNRPDAISSDVYGNAKYWWVIAMINNINDPFTGFTKGKQLKIPDIEIVKRTLGI